MQQRRTREIKIGGWRDSPARPSRNRLNAWTSPGCRNSKRARRTSQRRPCTNLTFQLGQSVTHQPVADMIARLGHPCREQGLRRNSRSPVRPSATARKAFDRAAVIVACFEIHRLVDCLPGSLASIRSTRLVASKTSFQTMLEITRRLATPRETHSLGSVSLRNIRQLALTQAAKARIGKKISNPDISRSRHAIRNIAGKAQSSAMSSGLCS